VSEPIAEEKDRLRRELRALRRGIGTTERRSRSNRLWRRVITGLQTADRLEPGKTILAFHGFDDEPPTEDLHHLVWNAGATLLLPRVEGSTIVPIAHAEGGPLKVAVLGVPEPTGEPKDPTSIDTVIVPALAFDRQRNRLGYGAGFYDRFIPELRPDCDVIGVCLAPLLVDRLPTEAHDVPVQVVVTDEDIIRA
jgi:5-formyltetrahydrofolate cyclo-ligase